MAGVFLSLYMAKKNAQINPKDLNRLKKKFEGLEAFDRVADLEMSKAVKQAENAATESFRTTFNQRTGAGRGSITSGKNGRLRHYVRAAKEYMPFLEFGTITKVDLSPLDELGIDRSYASQFKGKGKRSKGGIKAGHYFFPNVAKAHRDMIKRMTKQLKKILRK